MVKLTSVDLVCQFDVNDCRFYKAKRPIDEANMMRVDTCKMWKKLWVQGAIIHAEMLSWLRGWPDDWWIPTECWRLGSKMEIRLELTKVLTESVYKL